MDLKEAILERRSIRAFKPDPVPKEKIENILKLAIRAPSAVNLQPWEFTVVVGEERERLSRRLLKSYHEKKISCGPGAVKPMPKTYSRRGAITLAEMRPLFEEMKVQPESYINEGSCQFYGAPAALIICVDDSFSRARWVDIGVLLAYLVLVAHDSGIGACPIGLIAAYEEEVKDSLDIPENKNVVLGLALGYPDWDSPINRFRSPRDPLEKMIRWIETE